VQRYKKSAEYANFAAHSMLFAKKSEESSKNERVDLENLKRFAYFVRKLRVV